MSACRQDSRDGKSLECMILHQDLHTCWLLAGVRPYGFQYHQPQVKPHPQNPKAHSFLTRKAVALHSSKFSSC